MPERSLGDAAQTRAIIEQSIAAMTSHIMSSEDIDKRIDVRIDEKLSAVELRVKHWVIINVLVQLVAMLPVIFFLGGIYFQNQNAMKDIADTQAVLAGRGEWMNDRESWEQAVETWAKPQGFEPPRERTPTR